MGGCEDLQREGLVNWVVDFQARRGMPREAAMSRADVMVERLYCGSIDSLRAATVADTGSPECGTAESLRSAAFDEVPDHNPDCGNASTVSTASTPEGQTSLSSARSSIVDACS